MEARLLQQADIYPHSLCPVSLESSPQGCSSGAIDWIDQHWENGEVAHEVSWLIVLTCVLQRFKLASRHRLGKLLSCTRTTTTTSVSGVGCEKGYYLCSCVVCLFSYYILSPLQDLVTTESHMCTMTTLVLCQKDSKVRLKLRRCSSVDWKNRIWTY